MIVALTGATCILNHLIMHPHPYMEIHTRNNLPTKQVYVVKEMGDHTVLTSKPP